MLSGPCPTPSWPGRVQAGGSPVGAPQSPPGHGQPKAGVWVGNGSLCASPGPACTLGCYLVASIFRAGRLVASGPVYVGGRPLCRMGLA